MGYLYQREIVHEERKADREMRDGCAMFTGVLLGVFLLAFFIYVAVSSVARGKFFVDFSETAVIPLLCLFLLTQSFFFIFGTPRLTDRLRVRISRRKIRIRYYRSWGHPSFRGFWTLRIPLEEIVRAERFPLRALVGQIEADKDFPFSYLLNNKIKYDDYFKFRYILVSRWEGLEDGIEIVLLNDDHVVFETDDAENCLEALKKAAGLP